jgi:hypothetical protein
MRASSRSANNQCSTLPPALRHFRIRRQAGAYSGGVVKSGQTISEAVPQSPGWPKAEGQHGGSAGGSQNPSLLDGKSLSIVSSSRSAQDANFVVTVSKWLRNDAGGMDSFNCKIECVLGGGGNVLGTVGLTVRYGAKPIEFEKSKTASSFQLSQIKARQPQTEHI